MTKKQKRFMQVEREKLGYSRKEMARFLSDVYQVSPDNISNYETWTPSNACNIPLHIFLKLVLRYEGLILDEILNIRRLSFLYNEICEVKELAIKARKVK